MPSSGFHHVAFACRDIHETVDFYTDIIGLSLVHTEVTSYGEGYFRHVFFDTGDGSCLAFFDLHNVGEPERVRTDISVGMKLPVWVNHLAFKSDPEKTGAIVARLEAAGRKVSHVHDHDWCKSTYIMDPNGIMIELCEDTPGITADETAARALLDAVPDGFQAA